MRHNFIDRYATLDSPIHMLEARTKIIGLLGMLLATLAIPQEKHIALVAFYVVALTLIGFSRVPFGFLVSRTLLVVPFVLLAALAAPWRAEHGAVWLGALIFRSILCLLLMVLLTSTTAFPELLRGLRRLGLPRVLVLNLSFLYRYLFVLTEEVIRMRQARDSRRVGRAPVVAEVKLLGSMLGMLLLRSFERAERLHNAMLARGYTGELPIYSARALTWKDGGFLIGIALIIVFALML